MCAYADKTALNLLDNFLKNRCVNHNNLTIRTVNKIVFPHELCIIFVVTLKDIYG